MLGDHSRDSQFLLSSGSCLAQNKGRLVESTSSCGLTVSTSPKPPDVCAGRLDPAVSKLDMQGLCSPLGKSLLFLTPAVPPCSGHFAAGTFEARGFFAGRR